ncbi:DNA-binding GntR family transcriptional regulator [Actinocorallia herbida]|uniref:DNA-binding GntR family transcriptional regulator n=1 Tax=Actinocorallia herbida TaxID=58109 RepID=A0A3N1CY08_9ACTN|nr:FCD domain-containing protein [Actinocorallia herbida]ROO86164.1 DNA-binding GntR family transcriptional regulator [Actinocorallia herbida]
MRAVRDDILNGRLTPGSQLGFADLAARYDASTGVLREVLPRLVEQGLATTQAQLGYRVVEVSVEDLVHLTEARVAIETQVLGQSIREGDLDWESSVVAAHHRLTQLATLDVEGEINHEWLDAHRRFHQVLLEGCPSLRLREVAERLRDVSEVYRCWSVRNTEHLKRRDEEHARLTDLAVKRDIDGAKQVLADHITKTTDLLLEAQLRSAPAT